MLYLAIVLAAAVPGPRAPDLPIGRLPSPQEARKAVIACGLTSGRVTVRYERDMQEDILQIGAAGRLAFRGFADLHRPRLAENTAFCAFLR